MNDPWKDCSNFTDAVLDAFIRAFPLHPDHTTAVAELERRRQERQLRDQASRPQSITLPVSKGFLTRATRWIAPSQLRFRNVVG
jgi:hypothetical protein